MRPFDSLVQVCIIEHEQWTLSTCLESDVLQVNCRSFHDCLSSSGAAGECDLVDVEVTSNGIASGPTVPVHNVDHSSWDSSFLD